MKSGTQMECPRCQGDGFVNAPSPKCHHTGNCWCESVELTCPTCGGSGVDPNAETVVGEQRRVA